MKSLKKQGKKTANKLNPNQVIDMAKSNMVLESEHNELTNFRDSLRSELELEK